MGLISRVSSRTYRDTCMTDIPNDPVAEREAREADEKEAQENLAKRALEERNKICGNIPSAQVLSELAGLGDKEYLDQTVMPLVYIGLERLIHERPPNPVDWMAAFLLKNKALAPYKSL